MGDWYVIQRLDGYTNGKPSWLRYGKARTKEVARLAVEVLSERHPGRKFRMRKARRRK